MGNESIPVLVGGPLTGQSGEEDTQTRERGTQFNFQDTFGVPKGAAGARSPEACFLLHHHMRSNQCFRSKVQNFCINAEAEFTHIHNVNIRLYNKKSRLRNVISQLDIKMF